MSPETGTSRSTVTKVLRSGAISSVATAIVSLTVIPFVINGASLETYGAWATLSAMLAVARLGEGGISTEVARRVADAEGKGDPDASRQIVRQALTVIGVIGLGIAAIGVVVAVVGIPVIFSDVSAGDLMTLRLVWLASVGLLATSLVLGVWFATLGGLQRSDYGAYTAVAGAIAGAIATVVFVRLGIGIWSLLIGAVVNSVVSWFGPWRGMRRLRPDIPFAPSRVPAAEARSLLGASSFLLVASLAQIADRQVDKLVLTYFDGSDAAGVFQIATSLSTQPTMLAVLPAALLLAGTAELVHNQPERLQLLRVSTERASYAAGLLMVAAIVVFAPSFVRVWLGAGYESVATVTQILACAAVPAVLATPWGFYAMGRGWHSAVVIASTTNLVVNVVGAVVLTPLFGAKGAAVSSLIGAMLALVAVYAVLRRRDKETSTARFWRPFGSLTGLTVVSMLVLPTAASWTTLLVSGVLWVTTAIGVLAAVRALPIRAVRVDGRWRLALDR